MKTLVAALCLLVGCGAGAPTAGAPGTGGTRADATHPPHPRPDAADTSEPEVSDPAVPPADLPAIAGGLHGAFLRLDCAGPEIELQFCVPQDRGVRELAVSFGGTPGKKYRVWLGVWAVVEGPTYVGGSKGAKHFYVGGESSENPRKTASWGLEIGAQTYHLNHFEIGAGDHYTYGIAYVTPPIPIDAGAAIKLFVRDPDNFVNTNHMQSEAANPPPGLQEKLVAIKAAPPEGQYVYIEARSAEIVP